MAKLTLNDPASFINDTTAVALTKVNNDAIETALENTLSRDGTAPNTMSANLDMNSFSLINANSVTATTITIGGVSLQAKVDAAAASATAAAASATAAASSASSASSSATTATTQASNASTSATNAASSATTATTQASNASTSATSAASSATTASTQATNAATSATNAASSATTATTQASNASTSATNASTSATNAATSATNASTSETNAAASAAKLSGTSTTSVVIGTGAKTFTTQSGKFFEAGRWLLITSDAAPSTNFMHGSVTSYSGTTLVMDITNIGGSGTLTDWTITVAGTRGAIGATGAAGPVAVAFKTISVSGQGDVVADSDVDTLTLAAGTSTSITTVAGTDTITFNVTGLVIGTNVQAYDATLTSIAALGTAADKLAYTTAADTWAETAFTVAGRALIDDTTAAAQATTLGLGTGDSPQFTAVNVGHATDTTLARAAAGVLTVEGNELVYDDDPTLAAHATTMNPWRLGSYVTLTGTAVTFTALTAAPLPGAAVILYMNAAHIFTDGAVFEVDGDANWTAEAGDRVVLRAKTTTLFTVQPIKKTGAAVAGSGVTVSVQVFTANGTYTEPVGMKYCVVEVQAPGGGGAGSDTTNPGAGGGAGGYSREVLAAGAVGVETVTVPAGGAGGAAGANNGTAGATASFGALLSATGGGLGTHNGPGGSGGVGSGGNLNVQSEAGTSKAAASAVGGGGGTAPLGGGGQGGQQGPGAAGGNYGGGGGGGDFTGTVARAGGNGGPGIVIVTEYS